MERLHSLRGELLVAALDLVLSLPIDIVFPASSGLSHSSQVPIVAESNRATRASTVLTTVPVASELFARLANALCLALSIGRSHTPLAELALSAFEDWVALYTRLRTRNYSSSALEETDTGAHEETHYSTAEALSASESNTEFSFELLESEIKRILPHLSPFFRVATSAADSSSPSESTESTHLNIYSNHLFLFVVVFFGFFAIYSMKNLF